MSVDRFPPSVAQRFVSNEDALRATVTSGTKIVTGFATSEPHTFYGSLWDHIQREDLVDIGITQGLFMAPHKVLVGEALSGNGRLTAFADRVFTHSMFGNLGKGIRAASRKIDGLRRLAAHFQELRERRISFVSGFMSPATNMVIPENVVTRFLYPDLIGRNPGRMEFTSWQSIHFPDAPDALIYDDDDRLLPDMLAVVVTPPDAEGNLSLGVANGATLEVVELALASSEMKLVLYVNSNYPFTWGHPESPNTIHVDRLRSAADEGRLFLVQDDAQPPGLPAGAFDSPSDAERRIADNVVNHIESHRELTYGRALQVGIGSTGVLAVKGLLESSWTGRSYTEMLEPFTMGLWEAGKIAGTHFVGRDGRRVQHDGKLVATFTLGVEGSGFYEKLDRNRSVMMGAASRVVVPEGFYGGMGINNILGIDFQGHVNSSGRDRNPLSGIGGAGAIHRGLARGGVAYICMKSTHRTGDGERRSSVSLLFLPEGTPVSLVGPDLMGTRDGARVFLATEHGVAKINMMSQERFIRSIISVADPEFREWLAHRAWEEFRVQV